MISIITGDIVNSQQLNNPEVWLKPLKDVFNEFGLSPKIWDIYRGDAFQLEISEPGKSLITAIRIKAVVKKLKGLDVRMAIGLGTVEYASVRITESNGEAFINSGDLFEKLKENKMNLAIKSPWSDFDKELNLYLKLLLPVMDNWTTKSAELVDLILAKPQLKQNELADFLGIVQSSVSERQKRTYIDEILEVNALFNNKLSNLLE
ncbi:MAG: SatD family protein [Bacteroidota bacterium]|nr:SatD family protein [Bacteroidota bacterium]